ncbi:MAG: Maf family protein [bacterium]|nr:Maf family protein [bacterium]
MAAPQLILASASPRRRDLLQQVGLAFQIDVPNVDESVNDRLSPGQIVESLAVRKAEAVAPRYRESDAVVLGSDTLVFLEGEALGKPGNPDESRAFLQRLSGRTHSVYSGLCLLASANEDRHADDDRERHRAGGPGRKAIGHSRTEVRMRTLSDADIDDYLSADESADKAGGYAIQGRGAFLIEGIDGDYSNVVGLPLALLYEFLQRFGIRPLAR